VCRGHILAALSDRLLPDYARHVTGRAVWQAVARTYDLGVATPSVSMAEVPGLPLRRRRGRVPPGADLPRGGSGRRGGSPPGLRQRLGSHAVPEASGGRGFPRHGWLYPWSRNQGRRLGCRSR